MAQPRTEMTATEKLELIHAALAAGGTVYIDYCGIAAEDCEVLSPIAVQR